MHQGENRKTERGQTWVLLVMSLTILLAFVGLGIDFGLAYVTKTTLSKAVDAAALTAMQNVNLGTDSATCSSSAAATAGIKAFNINYASVPGLGAATPCVNFSVDANNNTLVNVSASTSSTTYFIRILGSQYDTLNVSASATAQRNPMVMSLVLDVSYSMENNGGSSKLPGAVENFVADFDPNNDDMIDWVSVVTFGTSAVVTVPNSQPFKDTVDTAMATNFWGNGVINFTNSQQGLKDGQSEILKIPKTSNLLRVLVFFTDGWPNIQEDTLTCPAHGTTKATTADLMYCGCDPGDESLGLCQSTPCATQSGNPVCFFNPSSCGSNHTCNAPTSGCGSNSSDLPTVFPDLQLNASESLGNVTYCGGAAPGQTPSSDAMYRSVLIANDPNTNPYTGQVGMLYQNTYIYAIGMGTAITGQPAAEEFLREVANDPEASTYNPSLPIGEADFTDAADLDTIFQKIASKILLRLAK